MNPADLTLTISPTLTDKALPVAPTTLKNGRSPVPRVDLEPIYTQLKTALGEGWTDYKTAVNAFILGGLNQAELSWVLQPLLSLAPTVITSANSTVSPVSTICLHNTLLAAIYANTIRDPPPTDVAPWVVATDKPTATSKTAGASGANDKAEERLKKEVMGIHPRDRRRIKNLKDTGRPTQSGLPEMLDYRHELAVKPPEIPNPQSAGGLQRTNWDIEIRRRYAQNLAEETLEFPTQSDVQNRIEPICYEEGLVGGCAQGGLQQCAELVEQATEAYLKELLGTLYAHSRSNGEGCVQTNGFRRQLRREEEDAERGVLQRSAAGFLPVELEMQVQREALSMRDLQLALRLEEPLLKEDAFLGWRVAMSGWPEFEKEEVAAPKTNGIFSEKRSLVNGIGGGKKERAVEDAMVVDEAEPVWRGASKGELLELRGVLEDCLAVG